MALFKLGFFHYRLKLSTYRLFSFVGIPLGIVLFIIAHKLHVSTREELWEAYSWRPCSTFYIENPARILLIIGYASALMLLCKVRALQKFFKLLSSVGRMALTNYIMQTVLCSFYFFGFGLGHYGEYDALQLLIFVFCIWMLQLTYSAIYLRYFEMGPVEWLWKRLTYGKAVRLQNH